MIFRLNMACSCGIHLEISKVKCYVVKKKMKNIKAGVLSACKSQSMVNFSKMHRESETTCQRPENFKDVLSDAHTSQRVFSVRNSVACICVNRLSSVLLEGQAKKIIYQC